RTRSADTDIDVLVHPFTVRHRGCRCAVLRARPGTRIARGGCMRTFLVLMLGVAAGCGGNDSVWSSSVSRLVLRSSGGFLAPSQPTADCPAQGVEYTLVVAGRSLNASRCTPSPTAPHPLIHTTASR